MDAIDFLQSGAHSEWAIICLFFLLKPESVSKMLVNQTLLCYGSIFACQVHLNSAIHSFLTWEFCFCLLIFSIFVCSYAYWQDNTAKMKLLNNIDHCLKAGKKYSWYMLLVSNACVALLSGLKVLLIFVISLSLER